MVGDRLVERNVAYVNMTWKIEKARSPEVGQQGVFRLVPGEGIDRVEETFTEALLAGVITQAAAWIKYNGQNYSGKDGFIGALSSDEVLLKEVRDEISEKSNIEFEYLGGEDEGDGQDTGSEVDTV